jgi:hypothetical protein
VFESLAGFLRTYIHDHWNTLGSEHFIALCTGVNIALIGWQQFQDRIRQADRKIIGKLSSFSASLADAGYGRLQKKTEGCLSFLRVFHKWVWGIIYGLAILGTFAGTFMLYARKSCPFDFFLLVPTALQLLLSWAVLLVIMLWIWFTKKGVSLFSPDQTTAANQIKTFVKGGKSEH